MTCTDNNNRELHTIVILCSDADAASLNIKEHLFGMVPWKRMDISLENAEDFRNVYEYENFRLVESSLPHIYQAGVDRKLEGVGLNCDLIIFASKHKSGDGRKLLTAHISGNPGDARLGGNPSQITKAAPFALRSVLYSVSEEASSIGYGVSMESTHHGPSDLKVPSVFAEIGSGESEWTDRKAGELLARAILDVNEEYHPVAIGFGGGHYASRQSEILLSSNITFGHNFPTYQLEHVDERMFAMAVEMSDADLVYLDRKAMSKKQRGQITGLAHNAGLPVLREGDIMEMGSVPWKMFLSLRSLVEECCPGSRLRLSDGMRELLCSDNCMYNCGMCHDDIDVILLDGAFIKFVYSTDPQCFTQLLTLSDIAYVEQDNGTVGNVFFSIKSLCDSEFEAILTDECIKILKEHYEIEYLPDEMTLLVTEVKFSPEMAYDLGIPSGPLFGRLAKGHPVSIEDRQILPEMVQNKVKRKFKLGRSGV